MEDTQIDLGVAGIVLDAQQFTVQPIEGFEVPGMLQDQLERHGIHHHQIAPSHRHCAVRVTGPECLP